MASPDNPKFIPDATGESIGVIHFRQMQDGVEYNVQPQPFRDRIVTRTPAPEYLLVNVALGVNIQEHGSHHHPKVDLRDLVLTDTGVSHTDIVSMLSDSGVKSVIVSGPRYSAPQIPAGVEQNIQVDPTNPRTILINELPGSGDRKGFRKVRRK